MPKQSAGLVAYRLSNATCEVLLVHPGGPFFVNKEAGAWSVPKGEYETGEDPLLVAQREFTEETGNVIKSSRFIELLPVRLKSGKLITAWAVEADFDQCFISSNMFELEWPPNSGKKKQFQEVDKAAWFTIPVALTKINSGQAPLLHQLTALLNTRP